MLDINFGPFISDQLIKKIQADITRLFTTREWLAVGREIKEELAADAKGGSCVDCTQYIMMQQRCKLEMGTKGASHTCQRGDFDPV